jgi:hypothetical protein
LSAHLRARAHACLRTRLPAHTPARTPTLPAQLPRAQVFSNGNLDPWSAAGVLTPPNPSVTTIMIEGGAHHLDLRLPNPDYDPPGVVAARSVELQQILRWIL